jgi:hypothetical protein
MLPTVPPANKNTKRRVETYKLTCIEEVSCPALENKTKQKKIIHCFFFNFRFIVHKEFLSQNQTVNQDVYKGILQRLLEYIRRRRPVFWATWKWFLLHNTARPHTTLSVKEI